MSRTHFVTGFVRSVVFAHRLKVGYSPPDAVLSKRLGAYYSVTYLTAVPGFRARAKMNLKELK